MPEEELKKQIEELKKKSEEYLNGWKRERADFLNYKKEEMERISEIIKYANEELILKLLSVLDNIYLAEKQIPDTLKTDKWIEGFLNIKNQLLDFLRTQGIEEIKAAGEKFNPSFHESVEEIEGESPGIITEEIQKGYLLNKKVIRASKVKITK